MNDAELYKTINYIQFRDLIENPDEIPFLVFITRDWLSEGAILDDMFLELSRDYEGQFRFYKLYVDKSSQIAEEFAIHRLPTVFIFAEGEIVDQIVGIKSRRYLLDKIHALI